MADVAEKADLQFVAGDSVTITGLVSAAALNGASCTVDSFDASKGRYSCFLADTKVGNTRNVLIKPANLLVKPRVHALNVLRKHLQECFPFSIGDKNMMLSKKLTFCEDDDGGVCVKANRPVERQEELLLMLRKSDCISVKGIMESSELVRTVLSAIHTEQKKKLPSTHQYDQYIASAHDDSDVDAIIVYMYGLALAQGDITDDLRDQEALKTLALVCATWPKDFGNLCLFWSEDEVTLLKGTTAYGNVWSTRKYSKDVFTTIVEPTLRRLGVTMSFVEKTEDNKSDDNEMLWKTYSRAHAALLSRVHEGGQAGPIIIPFVEMCNGVPDETHPACNVRITKNNVSIAKELFQGKDKLSVECLAPTRMIRSGEEVAINYGVATRGFVAKYGFIPATTKGWHNSKDHITLLIPPSTFPAPTDTLRWRALEAYDFPISRSGYAATCNDDLFLELERAATLPARHDGGGPVNPFSPYCPQQVTMIRQVHCILVGPTDLLQNIVTSGRFRSQGLDANKVIQSIRKTIQFNIDLLGPGDGKLAEGNSIAANFRRLYLSWITDWLNAFKLVM